MKRQYIIDYTKSPPGTLCHIFAWAQNVRRHKTTLFVDLEDSTGRIQCEIPRGVLPFSRLKTIVPEALLEVEGHIRRDGDQVLCKAANCSVVSRPNRTLTPRPRQDAPLLSCKYANYVLSNRHLFVRNSTLRAIIKAKHTMLRQMRNWLDSKQFTEVDTPIITPLPLYEKGIAFPVDYFGQQAYLSQCAALYLQAAVSSLERVYTVTHAFRAAPSASPRHNPEFLHIKGQVAFADLDEMIDFVLAWICSVRRDLLNSKLDLPKELTAVHWTDIDPKTVRQITYAQALSVLRKRGSRTRFGQSLDPQDEAMLSQHVGGMCVVRHLPRQTQPFPYAKHPSDDRLTLTADVIAPGGYGEVCGVAEFCCDKRELILQIEHQGRDPADFAWYLDMIEYASAPHSGFGAGVERILRWLLGLGHVRDTFMFPRLYSRRLDQ